MPIAEETSSELVKGMVKRRLSIKLFFAACFLFVFPVIRRLRIETLRGREKFMDMGNDIQESISRSYDVPEDVDEAELDAELEALGDEMEFGTEGVGESMPDYLKESTGLPEFIDEAPEASKTKEAAT